MIKELKIRNFKCCLDSQVHMNKLTVLAGANAVGKSSVIQSLLLMRQTIDKAKNKSNYDKVLLNDEYCLHLGNSAEVLSATADKEEIVFQVGNGHDVRPEIVRTMNSLNYPFQKYKGEIIRHLEAINDCFPGVFKEHHHTGFTNISRIFSTTAAIECTPENDRATSRSRTFVFHDQEDRAIEITCELHTKFTSMGVNKDRLYFHPGDERVVKNKVLVAYIGNHL